MATTAKYESNTVSIENESIIVNGLNVGSVPNNGEFPLAYDFVVAANKNGFFLIYSGERNANGKPLKDGDESLGAILGQGYDWSGKLQGSEKYISSDTNQGHRPGIGTLLDGSYFIAYQTNNPLGYPQLPSIETSERYPDGIPRGYIVGRQINATGTKATKTVIISEGANLLPEGEPPLIMQNADGTISIDWLELTPTVTAYRAGYQSIGGSSSSDNLIGTGANDYIYSLEGDDVVNGAGGNDYLDGGNGADIIEGGLGNDAIEGGSGNDQIDAGEGNDAIDSGVGNDTITAGDGNDKISAGDGNDDLLGGAGNDSVTGGEGNDTILTGDGNDTVDAGTGDDLIVGGDGAGNDAYNGGVGIDTVKYTSALAGITVDLAKGSAKSLVKDDSRIGSDKLSNIENVIAGNYADTITGSKASNILTGGTGNDTFVFNTPLDATTNVDTITDFSGGDKIALSKSIFKAFAKDKTIATEQLVYGDKTIENDDYLIYDQAAGKLYYDADGSGTKSKPIQIAIIGTDTHPTLTAADFTII